MLETYKDDYLIGAVAKMLGMTIPGIKYYEKYGITVNHKQPDSSYRRYSIRDIVTLTSARAYRNCGFTLPETADLLTSGDPEDIRESLSAQRKALQAQINLQTAICQKMLDIEEMLRTIEDRLNRFDVCQSPPMYAFFFSLNGRNTPISEAHQMRMSSWIDAMPLGEICMTLDKNAFPDTGNGRNLGICLEARHLAFLAPQEIEAAVFLPSRRCLHTVIKGHAHHQEISRYVKNIAYAHMLEQDMKPTGDPFGRTLFQYDHINDPVYYEEIFIPID